MKLSLDKNGQLTIESETPEEMKFLRELTGSVPAFSLKLHSISESAELTTLVFKPASARK